jgi:hypothetical protein
VARSLTSSAKCHSLGEASVRYRSSQRIAARSFFGDAFDRSAEADVRVGLGGQERMHARLGLVFPTADDL